MRWLNERFQWRENGYTFEDVVTATNESAGVSMDWFFDQHITGRELPPMDRALLLAGIERVLDDDEPGLLFGASTTPAGGGKRITRLVDDSPAFIAGLNVDDVILAIDGVSLASLDIEEAIEGFASGDSVAVTFTRRDTLREADVLLDQRRPRSFSYQRVASPTSEQQAMYQAWLWQPWPNDVAE
ncbi:MAG: PDZ domain-containing protein [Planctomycetota bacterium]